ncbi:MAG: hypothetical protein N2D54_11245, partial [Chloroflexota bacterium]
MKFHKAISSKLITLSIIIILVITFISPVFGAVAQPEILQEEGVRYGVHPQTGKLNFIGADPHAPILVKGANAPSLSRSQRGRVILEKYGNQFGVSNPQQSLHLKNTGQSKSGQVVLKYQQQHNGTPVIGGELILHMSENGKLYSLSGEISPNLNLSTKFKINPQQAKITALAIVAKQYAVAADNLVASTPKLSIFDERLLQPSTKPAELVWQLEVNAKDSLPINVYVLVNAQRGYISLQFNQVDTAWVSGQVATEHAVPTEHAIPTYHQPAFTTAGLEQNTYTVNNGVFLPGTLLCDESTPACTSGSDPHADAAHQYAADALDYFYYNHARDSLDG